MATTTEKPSPDVQMMQPTAVVPAAQNLIGPDVAHVTHKASGQVTSSSQGTVRFQDLETGEAGDRGQSPVNGEHGARPKAKQLHRKNTPATLPTVQKLCEYCVLFFEIRNKEKQW